MPSSPSNRPLRLRAHFFMAAGLATVGLLSAQTAPTTPVETDPWLQPLPEYIRPPAREPLPASEQQLEELLLLAASKSPVMIQQHDSVDAADAEQFRSWMRHTPVISASYSLGLFYQVTGTSGGSLTPGGTLTIQASQPIWHWGEFDARTNLGLLQEKLAQNQAIVAYANLCRDVRKRYYNLIVLKAKAATLAGEIDAAQRIVDHERFLLQNEHSTAQLVNNAMVDLEKIRAQQAKAEQEVGAQIKEFRRITGSNSFSAADVPDHVYLPVVDDPGLKTQLATAQKDVLSHSPLATQEALSTDAIDQQLIISRASRKPQLDFSASVSQTPYVNAANNGLKFGTIFFIGVTGTWTLWDRGSSVAQDLALQAEKHQVEAQFSDLRNQTLNDATDSLGQMDVGVRLLDFLKRQYGLRQENYRRALFLVDAGHGDKSQVDAFRNALLETRLEILTEQATITESYYNYISDIFLDPALANAPPFTKPR